MKRFGIKLTDKKRYKFDFAPLENDTGDSNWLDRTSSPAEQLSSYAFTQDSPTGISIISSALEDSNTSVGLTVQATAVGRWKVSCQATTTNSPSQLTTETMLFVVSD